MIAELRTLLSCGDRRSPADADAVLRLVLADPRRVEDVAILALDETWLVSLRAMDLLEKLVHQHPD